MIYRIIPLFLESEMIIIFELYLTIKLGMYFREVDHKGSPSSNSIACIEQIFGLNDLF